MLLDRVDANVAMTGHVWVENPGEKPDLGGIEGVGERDFEVEEKHSSFIGTSCNHESIKNK